jgi:hypothetical protein
LPSRDIAAEVYATVHTRVVELLSGTEAEGLCFPDQPPMTEQAPMVATSDMQHAGAFANLICNSPKSAATFLEFARCEAAEILAAHKSPVQAIADALIEHGTLDAKQIAACIAVGEAQDALAAEKARRRQWADTIANSESFKAPCISGEDKNVSTH